MAGDSPSSQRNLTMEAFGEEEEEEEEPLAMKDNNCVSYMEETTAPSKTFWPQKFREKWSRAALCISIVSFLVTLAFSLVSFVASTTTESSSIFASAFDGILGSFNSLIVAWRFRDVLNGELTPKREKTATLGLAVTFLMSGSATIAIAIIHLLNRDHPEKPDELIIILSSGSICYLALAIIQDCISKKLDSLCLKAAAVDCWLAAGMSMGVLAATFIYRQAGQGLWFLDHSVAIFIGFISLIYGIHLVIEVAYCSSISIFSYN